YGLDPVPLVAAAQSARRDDFALAMETGRFLMARNDPRAVGYYQAAATLRPDHPGVLSSLAQALQTAGDHVAAEQAWQRAGGDCRLRVRPAGRARLGAGELRSGDPLAGGGRPAAAAEHLQE